MLGFKKQRIISWTPHGLKKLGERRVVGMEERVAVSLEEAKETAVSILEGLGVPAKDAEITAEILIDTEAGGVESHGLIRLKDYVDRLVSGQIEPVPQIKINEQGAIAQIDGGYGWAR